MSFTNKLEQRLIDAQTFVANTKAVFKLDAGKVYASDMRLCNVGSHKTGSTRKYARNAGCLDGIRKIMLKDGNTVLSQLDRAGHYVGYLNTHKSNESNSETGNIVSKSSVSFKFQDLNSDTGFNDDRTKIGLSGYGSHAVPTSDSPVAYGWVYLRSLIPMLEATPFVSTNMFENLTIEIEFAPLDGETSARPFLVVNEVADDMLASKLQGDMGDLSWVEVERDMVRVDAVTGLTANQVQDQKVELDIKGFRGKLVNRLCLIKEGADNRASVVTALNKYASPAQHKESVNIVLNDSLLYEDAYNRPNKSLARSTDVSGTMTQATGNISLQNIDANAEAYHADVEPLIGNLDYKTFNLKDRVNNLRLQYERTAVYDESGGNPVNHYVQALNIHCYAEVARNLKVQNGSYLLSYA